MKKLMIIVVALTSFQAFTASELEGKNFVFKYEGGQHYRVSFAKGKVTWLGVKGEESGKGETDPYQSENLADGVHFIQWSEADGTFVALTIDLKSRKIISAGVAGQFKWFRKGLLQKI